MGDHVSSERRRTSHQRPAETAITAPIIAVSKGANLWRSRIDLRVVENAYCGKCVLTLAASS
jgi:hypothetical protein